MNNRTMVGTFSVCFATVLSKHRGQQHLCCLRVRLKMADLDCRTGFLIVRSLNSVDMEKSGLEC